MQPIALSRLTSFCLWATCGVAALLPLWSVSRGLWLDEYTTLLQFKQPSLADAMGELRYDTHHPLYFALLWGWHRLVASLVGLRLLSVAIYWGQLVAMFGLGRAWAGRTGALWAVALGSAGPMVLRFSTELRPYSLLCCAVAWAALLTLGQPPRAPAAPLKTNTMGQGPQSTAPAGAPERAAAWPHRSFVMQQLSYVVLVCTHPVGVMAATALWPLALDAQPLFVRGPSGLHLRRKALGMHAVSLGIIILAFAAMHLWFSRHQGNDGITWMPTLSWRIATRTLIELTGGWHMMQAGFAWSALLVLSVAALQHRVGRLLLVAAATHVAFIIGYSLVASPIFIHRALSPAWVCLTLGAALGASMCTKGVLRLVPFALGAVLVVQLNHWREHGALDIDPAHAVGQMAQSLWRPGDVVWAYPDWFDTAVRAEQRPEVQPRVERMGEPATIEHGILVLRLDADGAHIPQGLDERLHNARGMQPHTILYYVTDDDEVILNQAERAVVEAEALQTLRARFPLCRGPIDYGRYRALRCAPDA